jgi:hypothetical protein
MATGAEPLGTTSRSGWRRPSRCAAVLRATASPVALGVRAPNLRLCLCGEGRGVACRSRRGLSTTASEGSLPSAGARCPCHGTVVRSCRPGVAAFESVRSLGLAVVGY